MTDPKKWRKARVAYYHDCTGLRDAENDGPLPCFECGHPIDQWCDSCIGWEAVCELYMQECEAERSAQREVQPMSEGFYKCDVWPFYFMVNRPMAWPKLTIWGFSIYRNKAGYRTLGIDLEEWMERNPGAKIEHDVDRSLDKAFAREWRAKTTKGSQP